MRIGARRLILAALAALSATIILIASLWLHVLLGFGGALLGQPQALDPTLTHTALSLLATITRAALPFTLPMAILYALSGPWPIRLITLLVFAGGWYWAADRTAGSFAADFGATWLAGEPFGALFFDPLLTPLFLAIALTLQLPLLTRINRPVT